MNKEKIMQKKKYFWLGIVISIIFLYLAFRQIKLGQIIAAFEKANYFLLIIGLFLYLLGYLIRSIRWHYLLLPIKSIPRRCLFPIFVMGFTVNNIFPARLGEFVRAYLVGTKEGITKSGSLATIVMERIFDGLILLVFLFIALSYSTFSFPSVTVGFFNLREIVILSAFLFIFLFILFSIMLYFPVTTKIMIETMVKVAGGRWKDKITQITNSFVLGLGCLKSKKNTTNIFIYSIISWGIEGLAYYATQRAFGITLPFYTAILVLTIVNLGIMIPAGPGYVGTYEYFGILVMKLYNIPIDIAASYIITIHIIGWLPITAMGIFFFAKEGIALSQITSKRL